MFLLARLPESNVFASQTCATQGHQSRVNTPCSTNQKQAFYIFNQLGGTRTRYFQPISTLYFQPIKNQKRFPAHAAGNQSNGVVCVLDHLNRYSSVSFSPRSYSLATSWFVILAMTLKDALRNIYDVCRDKGKSQGLVHKVSSAVLTSRHKIRFGVFRGLHVDSNNRYFRKQLRK